MFKRQLLRFSFGVNPFKCWNPHSGVNRQCTPSFSGELRFEFFFGGWRSGWVLSYMRELRVYLGDTRRRYCRALPSCVFQQGGFRGGLFDIYSVAYILREHVSLSRRIVFYNNSKPNAPSPFGLGDFAITFLPTSFISDVNGAPTIFFVRASNFAAFSLFFF